MKKLPALNLPATIKEDIEKHGQIRTFSKGELLFTPEEMLERFFVVFKGRIKVSQVDLKSSKEQTLKLLTTGDMYDVVSLLDHALHENILTALDDATQIMVFPIQTVRSWIHGNNGFRQLLFPYVAKQIRDTEELALDLSFYNTSQRLLKLMVKNIDPAAPNKLKLIHDLPHEEIASLIGTVRKVLNRHIQELKEKDVIDVNERILPLKTHKTFWIISKICSFATLVADKLFQMH